MANNTQNPILVLGATGTVGALLSNRLVETGHTVRAATRSPESYQGRGQPVRVDLLDPQTWPAALDGVERLFVLAPPGHADQFGLLRPFLAQALTGGVRRVVTMTAQGVDASDEIPFRQLERFIEGHDVDYVHLRPTWFAQNFHSFWGHGVREHHVVALPAADAKVAFIDARDIAESAAGALTRDDVEVRRPYVLTGPSAMTHADAAEVLSKALGRTVVYEPIDDDAFRQQLAPAGLPADYIELLVGLFGAVRAGAAQEVTDGVQVLSGHGPRELRVYAADYSSALTA